MANINFTLCGYLRTVIISHQIKKDTWKIVRNFAIVTYVNLYFFAHFIPFLTVVRYYATLNPH